MREQYRVDSTGRVTEGANVRVLNNSWGQPGGYELSLEASIRDTYDAGIVFVAAAGNGNILGNGVDNDRTPFYPASYDSPNVIAVAASTTDSNSADQLATFSNYGTTSVDLFAPGVGVRSTLPGGGYGSANGTSMATPHVAGTAALVLAAFPEATVDEVKKAILSTVTPISAATNAVSTRGRLNTKGAITADVFAPAARLISKQDITTGGGTTTRFTIEYKHLSGIDTATLGGDDLVVTRQWGAADQLTATFISSSEPIVRGPVTATYQLTAPGGSWDPLDFGDYLISTVAGKVKSAGGNQTTEARDVGSFNVRIKDSAVLYVDTFADSLEPGTLRTAIIAANGAGAPRTIIVDSGHYSIDIPVEPDPLSTFPNATTKFCGATDQTTVWSNQESGDFDITGSINIVGNHANLTVIDGKVIDRVFKVHPGASLTLSRLTVTGGVSQPGQGGGGILSAGMLSVHESIVRGNNAIGSTTGIIRGGGIAAWDGTTEIDQSWITANQSDFGGGVFFCGIAGGTISRSTISNNEGGGLHSHSDTNIEVNNSTFSGNSGGLGAIFNGKTDGVEAPPGSLGGVQPSVSADGSIVAFQSDAQNLVERDFNLSDDIFVYNRYADSIERVSISSEGTEANRGAESPTISANGQAVAFFSGSGNPVPNNPQGTDLFVYDRNTDTREQIDGNATDVSLSGDGRFVVFSSSASNLDPTDSNGHTDVYVYDRSLKTYERISIANDGSEADGDSVAGTISADGRFVAFESGATNLVPNDTNNSADIFLYDREEKSIQRISLSSDGMEANGPSLRPLLSGNGQFVIFDSQASDLLSDDSDALQDVFAYDRIQKTIELVSITHDGSTKMSGSPTPLSSALSVSTDGRLVHFSSNVSNLAINNSLGGIFERDRQAGVTTRIFDENLSVDISKDGRYIAVAGVHLSLNDLTNGTTRFVTEFMPTSTIFVTESTITLTSGSQFSISGQVNLDNSLLLEDETIAGFDEAFTSVSNTITSSDIGADRIGPLSQVAGIAPVHPLLRGNPAIDNADISFAGTISQNGVVREIPDIGAYEVVSASVAGRVFVDLNQNQRRDPGEPGIENVQVSLKDALSENPPIIVNSSDDNIETIGIDELGVIEFPELSAGTYDFTLSLAPEWEFSREPISRVKRLGVESNGLSSNPSISADGRFVVFESSASNLVDGDTNNADDVFLYDRQSKTIERVSMGSNGMQGNDSSRFPTISDDGGTIAFRSFATNLHPDSANISFDAFVLDRVSGIIETVFPGEFVRLTDQAASLSLSGDGRFIAFASDSSNIVQESPGPPFNDVFIFDRKEQTVEKVSVGVGGVDAVGESGLYFFGSSLSGDGNAIAFPSQAFNIVPGESGVFVYDRLAARTDSTEVGAAATYLLSNYAISSNGRFVALSGGFGAAVPIFVYDRESGQVENIFDGIDILEFSLGGDISISGDGRFVAFTTFADDNNPNAFLNVFVFDRQTKQYAIVDVGVFGIRFNSSFNPAFSADGRVITFSSFSPNLVSGDVNDLEDVFVAPNPLAPPGVTRAIQIGDDIADLDLGLVPIPGEISGTVFDDTITQNGILDVGESKLVGWTVFLDANNNGILDGGESSTKSGLDGRYRFVDVLAYRQHRIAVQPPAGWEQVAPGQDQDFVWDIFLPAGGVVGDRDFAFQRITTTGQSSHSAVSGRLYKDKNGNGVFDSGIDLPIVNREVYLDATNFGVRDTNEPRVLTDSQGLYSISDLSSRTVAVTTTLDETLVHVSPLGSDFSLQKHPLFSKLTAFGNPQSISTADFNNDGFLDVAVALGEGNKLSIRLNDGRGGFLPDEIDVDLGTGGSGPTSLVTGQFDNNPKIDVALTANFASNVTVLLNFDPVSKTFASTTYVKVGNEPLDIVSGQFGGDVKPDLVVVNKGDDTVQLLINNGSGVFSVGAAIASGGDVPVSLVVGNFTGDSSLDIAVTHSNPKISNTPFGGVTVLRGNGIGGLTLEPNYYQVGVSPSDAATADINSDGRADLAVANFNSNSVSILLGQADGTFRVQATILGTASGAFDITVGDIDNDGDIDVIASNLKDRNISIFRNVGVDPTTGDVRFEPLENVGLGLFSLAQRMPLVVANFDNDKSGPGGTGTLDIVTIPQKTDTLHVLTNHLVNGTHRVALTGLNTVTGQDFIVAPAVLPPSFDSITNPSPIVEDATAQSMLVTGINKGRESGPVLQFTVTSSNTAVIANPTIEFVPASTNATIHYTPVANANGTSVVTVRAVDAGADQAFGGGDDGIFERSFTVSVLAVNDPPTFVVPAEKSVTQKDGAQSVANFVTGIGKGGGTDEDTQNFLPSALQPFTVASDASFFSVPPAIDAAGTLRFTPSPSKSGNVPVTVTMSDNGGKDNGGNDTTTHSFVINIMPVNDPPTFNLSNSFSVQADAGAQTHNGFASGFAPGGGLDEASQLVSGYVVSVDSPGLFAILPSIDTTGKLTFTPAIDRSGIATVSVQVRDNGGTLNGGVDLSAVKTFTITVTPVPDTTRPTPILTTLVPSTTNQTAFDVEIDFREAVNGFTIDDISVSSGAKGALVSLGNGKYKFPFTGADGDITFGVAANLATDLAGNQSLAAASVVRTIDSTFLTPTISAAASEPTNAGSFPATIIFGEPVVGFTLNDLTVLGGAASNLTLTHAPTGTYSVTIAPSGDGTLTVLLPAGVVEDVAGNRNASAVPFVRTIDQTAPSVLLSTDQPARTNKTSFNVIAEFGESVTGFTASDVKITGGSMGTPVLVSAGRYTLPITATQGAVNLSIAAGAVTDTAGNTSTVSNTIALTVDTAALVPVLSSTSASVLAVSVFDVSIVFGKMVSGFTLAELALFNASASNLVTVDANSGAYKASITATSDGVVTVLVPMSVATDDAGNLNAASNALTRHFDRTAPVPTLTLLSSTPGQAIHEVEVAFSEPVVGFDPSDLIVNGGIVGSLGRNRNNTVFSVFVTPTRDGDLSVHLPAGVVQDAGGLDNSAASQVVVSVDISRPVPTLAGTNSATVGRFELAISFNETVLGLTANDFQVTNATVSNLVGTGSSYTATLTAINPGELTITLPEERVTDGAGNRNIDSNLVTLVYNGTQAQTSIVLTGSGETVDMQTHDETVLATVNTIDIRGAGNNSLVLDAAKITSWTPNQTLLVIADQGDSIDFGAGWNYEKPEVVDGRFQRVFKNGSAVVHIEGPLDWTNPNIAGDVNGSGSVTAADALEVIVALNQTELFTPDGKLVDATTVRSDLFRFLDANEDGACTAADALFVINILVAQPLNASAAGESLRQVSDLVESPKSVQADAELPRSSAVIQPKLTRTVVASQLVTEATPMTVKKPVDSESNSATDTEGSSSDFDGVLAAVWNWLT